MKRRLLATFAALGLVLGLGALTTGCDFRPFTENHPCAHYYSC